LSGEIIVDEKFVEAMNEFRQPDKSKGLIENCSENVVLFAEHMLGFTLYSWQVKFLTDITRQMEDSDGDREFVAITSRQIGKSTSLAIFSIWCAVFNKYPATLGNNTGIGVVSATDRQARKLLSDMVKMLRLGDVHMKMKYVDEDGNPMFGKNFFTDLLSKDDSNNQTTMSMTSYDPDKHGILLNGSKYGSFVKSFAPTPAVLGETFSVILVDEAGLTEKITDTFFHEYLSPTGNATNAVRIYTSTPWVSSGFFYRLVDPEGLYAKHAANVYTFTCDAIEIENSEQRKVIDKKIKEMHDEGKVDEVQRAYFCRFVKGEQNYFDPNDVMQSFVTDYFPVMEYAGPCDLGVDFGGQTTSKTVLTVSELTEDGVVRRLFHKTYDVGQDNDLIEDITELRLRFNIQRIIPDDCPQGDYLIRKMVELGWDVTPMNFRSEKVKKYGSFRSFLKKGKIISYDDQDLKTEMLAMEVAQGLRNTVIRHAPGYTDDMIDSFILSAYHYVHEEEDFRVWDWDDIDD
jgi:hypothetical protein